MKVSEIGFYPIIIFKADDESFCVSIANVELFQSIKYIKSKQKITSLEIGSEIYFEFDGDLLYFKITDISINRIVEDTNSFQYGYDDEICGNIQGTPKELLFKVLIIMEPIEVLSKLKKITEEQIQAKFNKTFRELQVAYENSSDKLKRELMLLVETEEDERGAIVFWYLNKEKLKKQAQIKQKELEVDASEYEEQLRDLLMIRLNKNKRITREGKIKMVNKLRELSEVILGGTFADISDVEYRLFEEALENFLPPESLFKDISDILILRQSKLRFALKELKFNSTVINGIRVFRNIRMIL